jgi:hypothetical protein
MRVPLAVALVCLLAGGTAGAREHHEHRVDARHHLEKANALAGEGKCAAAVPEYTAAYEKLQDPIVLFNRADCYRRLGENAKAADDYRGYLEGFPAAPNRKEIEARIATLEKPAPPRQPAAASRPSPPPPVVTRVPSAPPPTSTAPAPAAPAPPPAEVGSMPFLPPPPGTGASTTLVEAPRPAEAPHAEASHGSHWLLWTTLAVVVVGGGVAGYLLLRPKDEPLPPVTLGNYRF